MYREIVHLCLQHKQYDPLGVVLLFRLSRIAATAKDLVLDQMTNKTSPPLFCGLASTCQRSNRLGCYLSGLSLHLSPLGSDFFELLESLHCYTMSKFTIV